MSKAGAIIAGPVKPDAKLQRRFFEDFVECFVKNLLLGTCINYLQHQDQIQDQAAQPN